MVLDVVWKELIDWIYHTERRNSIANGITCVAVCVRRKFIVCIIHNPAQANRHNVSMEAKKRFSFRMYTCNVNPVSWMGWVECHAVSIIAILYERLRKSHRLDLREDCTCRSHRRHHHHRRCHRRRVVIFHSFASHLVCAIVVLDEQLSQFHSAPRTATSASLTNLVQVN